MPVYTTGDRQIAIGSAAIDECPTSFIDDEAQEWAETYFRAESMRQTGAVPFSVNLGDWPALAVDAFLLMQAEHQKVLDAHTSP